MRRITAIGLILLLLFNVLGYQGLFFSLQYHHEKKISSRTDRDNYSSAELKTIKIPMALPYAIFSNDFERVDRKFEYKGDHYQLIKQKLDRDTLYLVCFKDVEFRQINDAFSTFAKTLTDQAGDSQPVTKIHVSFLKEYLSGTFSIEQSCRPAHDIRFPQHLSSSLSPAHSVTTIQPPEA